MRFSPRVCRLDMHVVMFIGRAALTMNLLNTDLIPCIAMYKIYP